MIKRFGSVLVLALGMLAMTGCCGAAKKLKECGDLTKTINAGVTKAKAINVTPATIGKFGDVYDETGTTVSKLEITTPELKTEQAEYVAMTKEVSKACHDAASSKVKHEVAVAEISKAAAHESAIIDKMNHTCTK